MKLYREIQVGLNQELAKNKVCFEKDWGRVNWRITFQVKIKSSIITVYLEEEIWGLSPVR